MGERDGSLCSPEIGIGILRSVYSLDNTVLRSRREMYRRPEFTCTSRRISSRLSFKYIFLREERMRIFHVNDADDLEKTRGKFLLLPRNRKLFHSVKNKTDTQVAFFNRDTLYIRCCRQEQ